MDEHPIPSEIEAKLSGVHEHDWRRLGKLTRLGPYAVRRRDSIRLHTVYLDTAALSLARSGVALRLRREGRQWEVTAKWPGRVDGDVHARPELTIALAKAPRWPFTVPEGPLHTHLAALVAQRPLSPIVISDVVRRRYDVFATDAVEGTPAVAELALDRVHLHAPGPEGAETRYCEVEIESRTGDPHEVARLAAQLRAEFALTAESESKFVRGVSLLYGRDHLAAALPHVEAHDSVALATRKIIDRHFRQLRQDDPGTRLGAEVEPLHDMRVATRRLRAAVHALPSGIPGVARRLHDELRWLANVLGSVRDIDVQQKNLARFSAGAPPGHRPALLPLRSYVKAEHLHRRAALLAALDSERYARLLVRLEDVAAGRLRPRATAATRQAIARAGGRAIAAAFRRLLKRGRKMDADPAPEDLHALRIRAKRLRYLLEFLHDITGKPGRRMVKRLVKLQDLLGRHHDAVVAADFIRLYVEGPGAHSPASTLLVLGAFVGSELRVAERMRADFRRTWRGFARKRAVKELDALEQELQARGGPEPTVQPARPSGSPAAGAAPRRARHASGRGVDTVDGATTTGDAAKEKTA